MTETSENADGAPMEWIRGIQLGRGSFATVHLAIRNPGYCSGRRNDIVPPLMVVKSSDLATADSLRNEREVHRRLGGQCPEIIRCFGDDSTTENGRSLYNLFFEYASGGSLSDRVSQSLNKRLSEFEVRKHTNSILRGLSFIHDRGFVHCDIKLQNILLSGYGEAKISDFGLAKERKNGKENKGGLELRGTPLYMAPEVVAGDDGDAPADVWALGCAVVEMVTGKPAWRCEPGCGVPELLCRIGTGNQSPEIPERLSEEGKDFLMKCFVRDPTERWTARMLSGHPFVSSMDGEEDKNAPISRSSPRGPFDFPENMSDVFCSPEYTSEPFKWDDSWEEEEEAPISASILERIEKLAGNPIEAPNWSDSDSEEWVTVR